MKTYRYVVRGRVQGVAFRYYAAEEARRLGISGSVRNRNDGAVEVVARGAEAALRAFEAFLWRGPSSARVETVERAEAPEEPVSPGFGIRR